MIKTFKFQIDTCHLSSEIDNMFDDWVEINVELSDEEVMELLRARKEWVESDEFKIWDSDNDEEYFLHKYVPNIHKKVRKALEEQAPSIWGKKIIPELYNVDIYLPDEICDKWRDYKKLS